ncbi:MAG: dTDP-4-dehydrorhamnose reductase [Rhodospirillaceae bacterium]|nr:MAG: dTDP-4-dehydrorhamnose reductase [Rhodospirillaceae bacterium]
MIVLVTGGRGQLGRALVESPWPWEMRCRPVSHTALDITRPEKVTAALADERVGLVINTAAYTAVDQAESAWGTAWAVNADGPLHLALACRQRDIPLIHLSTDYVFNGRKTGFYREDDPAAPLGAYGASKLAGEEAVRRTMTKHIIVRTSWLFSARPPNFVHTMVQLARTREDVRVVNDQYGCPTAAVALACSIVGQMIPQILHPEFRNWGTYHFCGTPACTWYDFAAAIFEEMAVRDQKVPRLHAIPTAAYPTLARRPANSALNCGRLGHVFTVAPSPWRTYLPATLRQIHEMHDLEEASRESRDHPRPR